MSIKCFSRNAEIIEKRFENFEKTVESIAGFLYSNNLGCAFTDNIGEWGAAFVFLQQDCLSDITGDKDVADNFEDLPVEAKETLQKMVDAAIISGDEIFLLDDFS
jgi:hypothetical protein